MSTEGTYLKIIQAIYDKSTANITLSGEKLKDFPLKSEQGCPLSPLPFNTVLEVLTTTVRQEREIKSIQIGREEVKLSLYAHDMILYIEKYLHKLSTKDSTQKLSALINKFSKVAGYKINIQKMLYFFIPTTKYQKGNVKQNLLKSQPPNKVFRNKLHQGCERLIH